MSTRRVKLGLVGLAVAAVLVYCRSIITKLTGSTNYPNPNPPLTEMTTAVDELEAAINAAIDGGKVLKASQRIKLAVVYAKMRVLRDYVNERGAGDEEKLIESGFPLADLPSPAGELKIPANLRAKTLPGFGNVMLKCNKVKHATGYQIRYRKANQQPPVPPVTPLLPDPISNQNPTPSPLVGDQWVTLDPVGPSGQSVEMLQSATYYEFQMRAIGAGKPSPWSDTATGLAA